MVMQQLRRIWYSGRTRRYHTVPEASPQSVADHTWGTLVILDRILARSHPSYQRISLYLLHHDSAEIVAGDTPAPAKIRHPEIRRALHELENDVLREMDIKPIVLNKEETAIAKFCDMAEAYFYAEWQYHDCGIPALVGVMNTALEVLIKKGGPTPEAAALLGKMLNTENRDNEY